jgi:hypothetical protein
MALQINQSVTTSTGAELPGLYIRVVPTLAENGTSIRVVCREYVNKSAYSAGKNSMNNTFFPERTYSYDASTDGADILGVACEKLRTDMLGTFTDLQPANVVID